MSVDDAWARVVDWCRTNAPVTFQALRPAAPAAALSSAEAKFPHPWPADLRRWYELQDGVDFVSQDGPLPHWTPQPVSEFWSGDEGVGTAEEVDEGEHASAATMTWLWLPSFVEIAHDITASRLFVDLRPGADTGCVTMWDRDEGALSDPLWPSVTVMLEQTAASIESGSVCDMYRPVVEGGALTWDFA